MNRRLQEKLRKKKAEADARVECLSDRVLERMAGDERGLWRAANRVLLRRRRSSSNPHE